MIEVHQPLLVFSARGSSFLKLEIPPPPPNSPLGENNNSYQIKTPVHCLEVHNENRELKKWRNSDDFWLRSPAVRKPFHTKSHRSIVARVLHHLLRPCVQRFSRSARSPLLCTQDRHHCVVLIISMLIISMSRGILLRRNTPAEKIYYALNCKQVMLATAGRCTCPKSFLENTQCRRCSFLRWRSAGVVSRFTFPVFGATFRV